jgi:hypothetical protein
MHVFSIRSCFALLQFFRSLGCPPKTARTPDFFLRLKACFHRFFSGFSLKMEATYEKQHDKSNPFFNIFFNLMLGVEKPKEVNW